MKKTRNGILAIVALCMLVACAGPDKKRIENGWVVVENECDAMSSMIRNKASQLRYLRELTYFSEEKLKIFELNIKATRGGSEVVFKTYANTPENALLNTDKVDAREINRKVNAGVDNFYGQPGKSESIDNACLLKGFQHD